MLEIVKQMCDKICDKKCDRKSSILLHGLFSTHNSNKQMTPRGRFSACFIIFDMTLMFDFGSGFL